MKYIKKYESFEGESVDDTVKDICLELEDIGYEVNYHEQNSSTFTYKKNIDVFEVNIRKVTSDAEMARKIVNKIKVEGEIKEVIERLKDYLGKRLTQIKVYIMDMSNGNDFENGWYSLSGVKPTYINWAKNEHILNADSIIAVSIFIKR